MKRVLILLLIVLTIGCDKDSDNIKYNPCVVDYTLDSSQKRALFEISNSIIILESDKNSSQKRAGCNGLLVANPFGKIVAFDLACPVEGSKDIKLQVESNSLVVTCPVCNSKYDVGFGGEALSGKAVNKNIQLKEYKVENFRITSVD